MKKANQLLTSLSLSACLCINAIAQDNTKLDEVTVVSAAGFEQNIADAPASISVITAKELEKKSYSDVLDAVKNIPGVTFTGTGSEKEIQIRGMDKEFTLYLIDSKPISTSRALTRSQNINSGNIGVNLPNIDMIERIEVIRGPMSSLYGSEAMGGVINIITKKVTEKWNGSISSEYTKKEANNTKNLSLYVNGPLIKDKLSLSLNAFKEKTTQKDDIDNEEDVRVNEDNTKLGTKLTWKIDDKNSLAYTYDRSVQENEGEANRNGKTTFGTKKNIHGLTHELSSENFNLSSYIQNDNTKATGDRTERQEENIITLNTQGTYFFENNTFTFGANYKDENYKDSINNEIASEVTRWLGALFVENEWFVTDDFALTTGIRYNHDELFKSKLTPRIYGVYNLNDNLTLKGGISTGYRQPEITETVEDFGVKVSQGRGVEVGNPDLKPEESNSFEAGFNYALSEQGLNSSIMIFKTDYKNKMQDEYICGTQTGKTTVCDKYGNAGSDYRFVRRQINVDKAEIKGVEFTFDYEFTPSFNIGANYTYTKSKIKSGDDAGEALNRTPDHMYNINLDWQASSKIDTWAQYTYRGTSLNTSREKSLAYGLVDLGVVYKATNNLSLKAGIYNAFDKTYQEDDDNTSIAGRSFNFGLNYKF